VLGEQAGGFDDHQGVIFRYGEMNDERANDNPTDLQSQYGQPIGRLAYFVRIALQSFHDLPEGRGDSFALTIPGGAAMKLAEYFRVSVGADHFPARRAFFRLGHA
jgi:hypothetical protein